MDKIEKLIDEAQEESLLVATCYDYIDKNGEHDTNWIMLNKAVETLKKIKQIVKQIKEERTFINYDKKKEKYLKDIIKIGEIYHTINNVSVTNWDLKSHKVCLHYFENYAIYYKSKTKKELYKMACENQIASRSHMNKKELIQALMKL